MLEPLSGMDAGFLYMETPSHHMHTIKVAIVDASGLPDGISFDSFRKILDQKLRLLPAFRQRVVEIPLGLAHPVWVPDPDFALGRHIEYRRLEAPGSLRQLELAVSEIASIALPRDRPLWQITMIDGLARGRVAFVCKLHHAMADGSAVLEMLLRVLHEPTPAGVPVANEPLPSRGELLLYAARRAGLRIAEFPKLLLLTLVGLLGLIARARENPQARPPRPFSGPTQRFNGALTPNRCFRTAILPIADLKRIRRHLGVTLNDVVLAICAGALRTHLGSGGDLPKRSLVAGIPINTHPSERGRVRGNHVGHLMTSLFTDVDDPIERILAIHRVTREAKDRQAVLGLDLMERWFEYTPPKPYSFSVRFWSKHRLSNRVRSPINLVVSSVAGPRESFSIAGAELEALYSVGPILEGIGLNITAWSYADEMYFVALACPEHVPDLDRLCEAFQAASEELLRACDRTVSHRVGPAQGPSTVTGLDADSRPQVA